MKKRIICYRKHIDEILLQAADGTDWDRVLAEHLTQISFFQHERLVHLIVTVTFAILTMLAFSVCCIAEYMAVLPLIALFLVLLVPYIAHYYTLENEVQKIYRQYDEIIKHCK